MLLQIASRCVCMFVVSVCVCLWSVRVYVCGRCVCVFVVGVCMYVFGGVFVSGRECKYDRFVIVLDYCRQNS